ncbi:hypothetical protein SAMN05192574_101396 [Mucilaginibacter gossypiicola]|uniref:Phage tail tape measure protein, TP901 family, core region n=1 Tax=Mucilaginibacter gossypiicola TaxID=551995 RepID=A0A1H8A9Z2_9SPHI|nr:hypothetical protein [Mucilaginibacter gossypiicola]SEM66619.1 hypothetical protein SAMN05192574_101396 [Mucilaginibacter gossypiicola]
MADQTENAIINLVINGEQAKATYKELNKARADQLKLVQGLKETDPIYQRELANLRTITEAQRARREELNQTITSQQLLAGATDEANNKQKSFFADFKEGFKNIGEMAGEITAGTLIYKGVSAAIGFVKDVWNGSEAAFVEAEKTQAQLAAALASTGGAAGISMDALQKMQQVEMDKTGVDDDVIAKAEEMLLTFTNVGGKIYEKALPAILDYTSAMNGGTVSMEGVQTASIAVGKALNDPINGLTSLRKVGVTFNDQQKEQIKLMQESGDIAGAQTIILKELEKEFGGTAEAIRNTSSGALDAFNTDLGNLQERIGSLIVSFKGAIASIFDPLVKKLGDARSEAEQLTDEFKKQSEAVDSLQKNTTPLIERYDQLKQKGKLNKDEQKETKDILNQIADVIPSAVTKWDQYGNALEINTKKARDFVGVQKALLEYTNKDAISALVKERNEITFQRNALIQALNKGTTTEYQGGGTVGTGTSVTRQLTPDEIRKIRADLQGLVTDTKKIDDTIKGLNGSFMDDLNKKTTATTGNIKALGEMTVGELNDRIKSLNASLQNTVIGSEAYKKIIKDINDTEKLLQVAKNDKKQGSGAISEREQTVKDLAALAAEYKQFDIAEIASTKAKNDKELDLLDNKYQQEIDKQVKATQKKNLTKAESDALDERIAKLKTDKETARNQLIIKQQQDLNDKIAAYNNKLSDQLLTQYDKERDDINAKYDAMLADAGSNANRIATIEKGRAEALANAKINEEKRFQEEKKKIEADGLVTSADSDEQERARINKKYDDEIAALKSKFSEEEQATKDFKDAIAAINKQRDDEEAKQAEKEAIKKRKANNEMVLSGAKTTANALFEITNRNRQADTEAHIRNLENQKNQELSNKNLTEQQRAAIEDKYAKQEAEVKRKQWEAEKQAAIVQAIINGALAMTKVAAQTGILSFAFSPLIALETAAQIAVIASQKAPEFEDGGILPDGPSHSNGGINLVGPYGQIYGQIEGGEPVLSKKTYANNKGIIDALLNSGGAPLNYDRVATAITDRERRTSPGLSSPSTARQSTATAVATSPGITPEHIDMMLDELKKTREAIQDQQVIFNDRAYEIYKAKKLAIRDQANA